MNANYTVFLLVARYVILDAHNLYPVLCDGGNLIFSGSAICDPFSMKVVLMISKLKHPGRLFERLLYPHLSLTNIPISRDSAVYSPNPV